MARVGGLLRGAGAFGLGAAYGFMNEYDRYRIHNRGATWDDFYKQTRLAKHLAGDAAPISGPEPQAEAVAIEPAIAAQPDVEITPVQPQQPPQESQLGYAEEDPDRFNMAKAWGGNGVGVIDPNEQYKAAWQE